MFLSWEFRESEGILEDTGEVYIPIVVSMSSPPPSTTIEQRYDIHTHQNTHTHTYRHIYICVCACVSYCSTIVSKRPILSGRVAPQGVVE